MDDTRKAGLALILGSLGGVLTMAMHPTVATAHLMAMSGVAHTLAMVSELLLFLGAVGLTRFLADRDRLAFAGLVVFGLALVAVVVATGVSGFVMPALLGKMGRDTAEMQATWRVVLVSIFGINQAFSKVYAVAAAGAIALWSVSGLRVGRMARWLVVYGCCSDALVAVLIAVGHLRLDVHGMTAVMVTEVVWFVGVGVGMRREGEASGRTRN